MSLLYFFLKGPFIPKFYIFPTLLCNTKKKEKKQMQSSILVKVCTHTVFTFNPKVKKPKGYLSIPVNSLPSETWLSSNYSK